KQPASQARGVSLAGVAQPAGQAAAHLVGTEPSGGAVRLQAAQTALHVYHVGARQQAVGWEDAIAAVDRGMAALAGAVGVAVVDEAALEDWPDDVAQRVMHDPIPEGGGADETRLGAWDGEGAVFAGLIGVVEQLVLEAEQLALEVEVEADDVVAPSLTAHGL